jgi:hypothetical protein
MAATTTWYGAAFVHAFNGALDWDTDTIKIALTTSGYTPNQDTHEFFNQVTNEVTGTGYTAGGATLIDKNAMTLAGAWNAGTNKFKIDAGNVTWNSSTITARYAVIYKDTGTAGTSPLIAYILLNDTPADVSSGNGDFTINFHADGIAEVTVS